MNQQKWIRKPDAIEQIAPYCYPEEDDFRAAKQKVRNRIDYACNKGQLKQFVDGSSWKFNRDDFFQWAVSKWPELRQHFRIPVVIKGGVGKRKHRHFPGKSPPHPIRPRGIKGSSE